MRTSADALRSMKRHVSLALGGDWEIRMSREEGAFRRPFARVGTAVPASFAGASAFHTDVIQPFFVHAYPEKGTSPDDAVLKATEVEEALFNAFARGLPHGAPRRVPLYDYEGVALDDPGSLGRNRSDYLRVNDLSIGRIVDQDDNSLWIVVADVRLGWRRGTSSPPEGRPAADVTASPTTRSVEIAPG